MKIVHVTSGLSKSAAGVREVVAALSAAQQSYEQNVKVIGLDYLNWTDERSEWLGAPAQALPILGPCAFGYAPAMTKAILKTKADILHLHGLWMYPSLSSLRCAKTSCQPYLISPHGMLDLWALRNSRWKKRFAGWAYENAHLRGAACLHALCEAEAEAIRAYGLRNPICIIPNGIDLPPTRIEPPPWQAAMPEKSNVLFYLGRLHPKKGLFNLLTAWAEVYHSDRICKPWILVIAGWDQGGHEFELKSQTIKLGIQETVFFVGSQFDEAKAASYRSANAFVLPSFSEGLPMTVLEAWSHSLPVLMTPQCNLSVGYHAEAALSIDPTPESISIGLKTLFGLSDADRAEMGERGRTLVSRYFNWPAIAEQMLSVYFWVLGQSHRPKCVHLD